MEDTQQRGQDKEGRMAEPGVSRIDMGTVPTGREIGVQRRGCRKSPTDSTYAGLTQS